MLVLGFPENLKQAQLLSEALDCPLAQVKIHHFPDGESLVTLPEELPETLVVFRSLYDPNAKLIELIFALQAARAQGVKRLILVAPYLCYMRQDKAFQAGEAVSQKIIAGLLGACTDHLITVDPHLHRIHDLAEIFTDCQTHCLSAAPLLGGYLNHNGGKLLLVAPDEEALRWASIVADSSGLEFVVASKQRISDREVRISLPHAGYQGTKAIIVDDVISSGKTVVETANQLKARGASSVGVLCTHALFAPGAEEDMATAGIDFIVSSNAIPHRTNSIDLSPMIAEAVRGVL